VTSYVDADGTEWIANRPDAKVGPQRQGISFDDFTACDCTVSCQSFPISRRVHVGGRCPVSVGLLEYDESPRTLTSALRFLCRVRRRSSARRRYAHARDILRPLVVGSPAPRSRTTRYAPLRRFRRAAVS